MNSVKRVLSATAAVLLASAVMMTSAYAGKSYGSGTFAKANGDRVKLSCKSSGCFVNGKRIGPVGVLTYPKLVQRYQSRGYTTKCGFFSRKPPCKKN